MEIPNFLLEQIRGGKVVLFLGAGASLGSFLPSDSSRQIPNAKQLKDYLCDTYLGGQEKDKSLSVVAEYAISEADLFSVQNSIREILQPFEPAEFHKKISQFRWKALVTTNYDLIIEKAYIQSSNRLQNLLTVVKTTDRFESEMKEDSLIYLKLHGCIEKVNDIDIPLILTIDQYVTHKQARRRLFERFKSFATDCPVIFVGYRLEDSDLRQILLEIDSEKGSRPRHYVITPKPNERDMRIWEQKKIATLDGKFEDFINSIDESIIKGLRAISLVSKEHVIEKRFSKRQKLSSSALAFVTNDVNYLCPGYRTEKANPVAFYKGADYGWASICAELDIRRSITDTILSDIVLCEEIDRPQSCDFYVVKGYAGAGKTILLKRLAWDAANTYEKIVLYYLSDSKIVLDPIEELLELIDERIFLFIDRAASCNDDLERFVKVARKRKLKITIITAERTNEWNNDCENLEQLVDESYELKSLSSKEVDELLRKLKQNSSLGTLAKLSPVEQRKSFLDYAGRQLLVALYEATSGLPFEQIVFDEYKNIFPNEARDMYLTICSLHRLGVAVRAGIIKRMTDISFIEFRQRFFKPLESIIFTEEYKPALDMAYRSRHPWIAEKVFEKALPTLSDRYDFYVRLLDVLDIGYSPDREAFRELIKAKSLLEIFSDEKMIREIYAIADKNNPNDPYLHHQLAIYEMKKNNGNLDLAYSELILAEELAPYDKSIKHSFSELELQRSLSAKTKLERNQHLNKAKEGAKALIGNNARSSHGYATIIKVEMKKLSNALHETNPSEMTIADIIKEIENIIQDGLERFPGDEFLISLEAKFVASLNNEDKSLSILEKAFARNSANQNIARALARLYEKKDKLRDSRRVLEECLNSCPHDKLANAACAKLLTNYYFSNMNDNIQAEKYWRRSFTDGDANYSSQFWYARQLFINGKLADSRNEFKKLRTAPISNKKKHEVNGVICAEINLSKVFTGFIEFLDETYIRLKVDGENYIVPASKYNVDSNLWSQLHKKMRIKFNIGFNFHGASAINLSILLENPKENLTQKISCSSI